MQRVIDWYQGQPCTYVRPAHAPVRPGEVCGQIHLTCKGHTKDNGLDGKPPGIRCGDPCGAYAKPGLLVCKFHGANTPQAQRAGERNVARERALGELGQLLAECHLEVTGRSDAEAMRDLLDRGEATVMALGYMLDDLAKEADADVKVVLDDKGAPHVVVTTRTVGLVGPSHAGDLAMHPLIGEYGRWLDRVAKYRKNAHDMGIAERRAALDESHARAVGTVVMGTLKALGIGMDDARIPSIIAAQFRALDVTARELEP